jgi:8-oxo-dGTP diphosphatase
MSEVSGGGAATQIRAAGALLWRPGPDGPLIAVVHRVRQQDWSLPKGKLEHGEHWLAAAVREVHEETGQRVALGRPLPTLIYPVLGVPKVVRYWAARGGEDSFAPTHEVDAVDWLTPEQARERLSYPHDYDVVAALLAAPADTVPFVILRHAKARPRNGWPADDDHRRPLAQRGVGEAERLAPLLAAYGVQGVHSSDTRRCEDTVRPYCAAHGLPIRPEPLLSERGFAAQPDAGVARTRELLTDPRPVVLCTHRPVLAELLPRLFGGRPPKELRRTLEPGAFVVLHRDAAALAAGADPLDAVVARERHRP